MKTTNQNKFKWLGPYEEDPSCFSWTCLHPQLQNFDVKEFTGQDGKVEYTTASTRESSGPLYSVLSEIGRIRFSDKDEAATVVLALVRAHNKAVSDTPIPNEYRYYLEREARNLESQANTIRDLAFSNRVSAQTLREACAKARIDVCFSSRSMPEKLVDEINEFKLDGSDTPFFSKEFLYRKFGKQDARSILALIKAIKRAIDPVAAEE